MAKYPINTKISPGMIMAAIILVILLIVVVGGFLLCMRVVQVGHVGIVTSFGKIDGTFDPGLHFALPWQHVVPIDCRVQKTSKKTACYSKDLQSVEVDIAILTVLVKDQVVEVYSTVGMQYLEQVEPRVSEILKQHIATYEAEKLIESREKIRDEVLKTCQERLKALVEVRDVVLANFDFSDEYERAIERKQVALQDSLRAENELKKAKIEAEQAIETAKGEAEAIRVRGDALKENPGVAQLEAIKRWDGKSPQTVVLQGDAANLPVVFPIK